MKYAIATLLILLTAVTGFTFIKAQESTITGQVVDQSNAPVAAAIITTNDQISTSTGSDGKFQLMISEKTNKLTAKADGYKTAIVKIEHNKSHYTIQLKANAPKLDQVQLETNAVSKTTYAREMRIMPPPRPYFPPVQQTESYKGFKENEFNLVSQNPLSTFSIDVDNASYSNIRRFLNNGQMPPNDAVRIEEMINYFDYNYPAPTNADPVNIISQVSYAPWNPQHKIVQVALQAKRIDMKALPAANLVFLIDVSGSMNQTNKLPLLQSSMKMLAQNLRPNDKVSIVTYAGNAGLVLPSTSGSQKQKILDAINNLNAGGSTAGGAGIKLAYKVAQENFIKNGNNRIILASDGDFNVSQSSDEDMEQLIEAKRKSGVFLTVLGFGMSNYKDSKMEVLADKGNGNYAYIDNIQEARKVLVKELGSTLFTVAKDVKLQVEFNPELVAAYRLIGYENRLLNDEDFNDDRKDAGEMGAGHSVTAFYEIIPVGVSSAYLKSIDDLKFQKKEQKLISVRNTTDLIYVKMRYKNPDGDKSMLLQKTVQNRPVAISESSDDFRFALSVAEFGMLLRKSDKIAKPSYRGAIARAEASYGSDKEGYRREMVRLMQAAMAMEKE